MIYPTLRRALFALPPEAAHQAGLLALRAGLATTASRRAASGRLAVRSPRLASELCGLWLPNPVGVAAGFDKAGEAFNPLGALGFGFVEIGTVTALPQPGNPLPRLFRLPADEALLNRFGFNNPGATAVAAHLARHHVEPVLGINIGKSKATRLDQATDDYLRSFRALAPHADYVAVNVSSPNTPGLRALQDAGPLRELLTALRTEADQLRLERAGKARIPILLKIAPDLSDTQIDRAAHLAAELAAGIIATNTTTSREGLITARSRLEAIGAGGVSGRPLHRRAVEVVSRIYRHTAGGLPIVGVGGIFTAADAWAHLRAGARVVQLYTGFIYGGPSVARRINEDLLELLDRHDFGSIAEVVGTAHH